jgi:hypothetical protein
MPAPMITTFWMYPTASKTYRKGIKIPTVQDLKLSFRIDA